MVKYTLILICLLLLPNESFTQSQKKIDNSSKQTLEELTRITSEIYDAGISANKSVIEKYLADNYLETDATGILRDKAWNIANPLTANEKLTYKIEEPEVREYDKVAVLYYKWIVHYEVKIPAPNKAAKDELRISDSQLRVTDTFIRTANGWQMISSSRVRLPSK